MGRFLGKKKIVISQSGTRNAVSRLRSQWRPRGGEVPRGFSLLLFSVLLRTTWVPGRMWSLVRFAWVAQFAGELSVCFSRSRPLFPAEDAVAAMLSGFCYTRVSSLASACYMALSSWLPSPSQSTTEEYYDDVGVIGGDEAPGQKEPLWPIRVCAGKSVARMHARMLPCTHSAKAVHQRPVGVEILSRMLKDALREREREREWGNFEAFDLVPPA